MSRSICRITDCAEPVVGQELCRKHYMRQWRNGSTSDKRKNARGVCKVRGCARPHRAHGLCDSHYHSILAKKGRAKARQGRKCEFCDGPIPTSRKASAKFCSVYCKNRAHNTYSERRHNWQRAYFLRTKFGLSLEDYEAMLAGQHGCCAICQSPEPRGRGRWHVDHDHVSGKVRGLLCNECNTGLGKFKDDPSLMEAAATYLRA